MEGVSLRGLQIKKNPEIPLLHSIPSLSSLLTLSLSYYFLFAISPTFCSTSLPHFQLPTIHGPCFSISTERAPSPEGLQDGEAVREESVEGGRDGKTKKRGLCGSEPPVRPLQGGWDVLDRGPSQREMSCRLINDSDAVVYITAQHQCFYASVCFSAPGSTTVKTDEVHVVRMHNGKY